MFKVTARTVLELGAELISSDAVAIYELVKNAVDARSKTGVTIEMSISMKHSNYVDLLKRIDRVLSKSTSERWTKDSIASELADIKREVIKRIELSAPAAARREIVSSVGSAESLVLLRSSLEELYEKHNYIEFRDTGCGMTVDDLIQSYLVIGTPSRRRVLDKDLGSGSEKPTYLGEKGVGRLSVMRLGSKLSVTTATEADKHYNLLEIDWTQFEDLDRMIEDVQLVPRRGARKTPSDYSGTVIRVSALQASWSLKTISEVATWQLARITDPFIKTKRRLRIEIIFNGERVEIPRLERSLLDAAQARAWGTYSVREGSPSLEINLWCGDLGMENPPESSRIFLEKIDLISVTKDADSEVAAEALSTVGPFTFELYWYNRLRAKAIDGIGDRQRVLQLLRQWSGVMLFRDGYRVFPYGDDRDDWLGLDRRALASPGYKLNKAQFLGRVEISRTANPKLIDQTNREGLKDCDEKAVLLEALKFVIQNRLRNFLDDVAIRHRASQVSDLGDGESQVKSLRARAMTSLKALERRHSEESPVLHQLTSIVEELNDYFMQAKERAEQIEDERDRMIQLAGVGLMLEVVAHELARSTEHTIEILNEAPETMDRGQLSSLFSSLRDEMVTMNKRLRVLDPLSVSGRQRKESFDFAELVSEVFEAHAAQFRRHSVTFSIQNQQGETGPKIHGVRGMFVQILENLIQNSLYWMKLKRSDEADYKPKISIKLGPLPTVMEFRDNGPGIHSSLQDEVFKAFFSTKGKSRRQGLGLFIARDCATHNGMVLYLSPESSVAAGRLNTFVLEYQEEK